jgi:hypothetical protein
MQDMLDNLTFDTAPSRNGREAERPAFTCRDWACTGAGMMADTEADPDVQVTDVWIRPDNCYCFEVMVGGRKVADFSFDDLGSATAAAGGMRRLAPAVSTVLREMRTGKFKRDFPGLDGRRFW